jgi:hypothetical protein
VVQREGKVRQLAALADESHWLVDSCGLWGEELPGEEGREASNDTGRSFYIGTGDRAAGECGVRWRHRRVSRLHCISTLASHRASAILPPLDVPIYPADKT